MHCEKKNTYFRSSDDLYKKVINMSTLKKLITQVSLLASAIFCSQIAIACPEVFDTSALIKLNTSNDIDAETIYFCKQNGFTINQLSVSFEPNALI